MMIKHLLLTTCALLSACSKPGPPEAALVGDNSSAAATTAASPDTGGSGPFGYTMGEDIGPLKLTKLDKPGLYQTSSPPKPHADFESVVIEAYPGAGICQIRGVGKNIDNDGDGGQIRSRVDELAATLATKYGDGKKVDRCSGGDPQCDAQFWMMTMNGGERFYGYGWDTANPAMKAVKIRQIIVAANAADINTSYPVVEYHSSDLKACDAAKKRASAASL